MVDKANDVPGEPLLLLSVLTSLFAMGFSGVTNHENCIGFIALTALAQAVVLGGIQERKRLCEPFWVFPFFSVTQWAQGAVWAMYVETEKHNQEKSAVSYVLLPGFLASSTLLFAAWMLMEHKACRIQLFQAEKEVIQSNAKNVVNVIHENSAGGTENNSDGDTELDEDEQKVAV